MRSIFQRKRTSPVEEKAAAMPVTEYLRRVDLFKSLSMEEIGQLFKGVMIRECVPGTVFFAPEDLSERLFILKKGQVELYRLSASGRKLVTRRIGPGTVFGEMGLLGQTMQGEFAEATVESLVCVATRADVERLIHHQPDIALRLLEGMGNRLRKLEDRLEQAVFSPVRVRVAHFLLANADSDGRVAGYTHADIGDNIGALRQTVTETLSQMQAEGLISVGHKAVRIKDRAP